MPSSADKQIELHRDLKAFYSTSAGYFEEASEANAELSEERANLFSWIKDDSLVLDVGCGPGDNGRFLGSRTRYIGCDLSGVALRIARAALPECRFVCAESQQLPFETGTVDVVLSTYALEHFVFARKSLDEMWRVCRPGGLVILISPAYDDPRQLPPSTSDWSAPQRGWLMLRQAGRQVRRHLSSRHYEFACVSRPRILRDAYQSDFDAVHLVSAREVSNFLRAQGGEILFERKRRPRPVQAGSFRKWCLEHLRNVVLRMHLAEYSGLNLQIVAAKSCTEGLRAGA